MTFCGVAGNMNIVPAIRKNAKHATCVICAAAYAVHTKIAIAVHCAHTISGWEILKKQTIK
jgi:hypothetical protein